MECRKTHLNEVGVLVNIVFIFAHWLNLSISCLIVLANGQIFYVPISTLFWKSHLCSKVFKKFSLHSHTISAQ